MLLGGAIDQYSLLHFSVGVVAYFWHVPFWLWIILNILFEIFENSSWGMRIISHISVFPGGQPRPDTLANSICDIICCLLGWGLGYFIDYLGKKYLWYIP